MSNHIFEELPARKHAPAAPAAAPAKGAKGKTEEGSEKRIRQAVYDIRYRARREDIDLKQAFSQYMSNSSLNPAERTAVKAKLFGKEGGGVKEQYGFESIDWASDNIAGAMFKVFYEGIEKKEGIELSYEKQLAEEKETKYKVRVTDTKNNRSYVRYATREKITQLRARGLKVEMTEHGEPYEGERKRGERTARALGGGRKEVPNNKSGLDKPVHPSKRDGDVNDDGKKDKTDSYIYNRRDAINAAIAKKKGMKEEFLADGTTSTEGQNSKKIDIMPKEQVNKVKVFPSDGADPQSNGGVISAGTELNGELIVEKAKSKAQQRFMGMVYAVKKGEMEAPSAEVAQAASGMSKKEAKKFAKTKHKGLPEKKEMKEEMEATCPKCGKCPCECDNRDSKTYRDLLKNKIRSMGIKNPIMLDAPEGEEVMKIMSSSSAKMAKEGREFDEPGERGPEVERHNAALRKGKKETVEQRMNRKAAEQRASGKAGYGRRRY